MKRFLEYLMLLLVLLTVSCSSETYIPEEDSAENYICFMAFTETMTKGEIDAVSDIENLYVTETLNNTFKNVQLQLQQNGICRTNEPWTSGAYSFFGYASYHCGRFYSRHVRSMILCISYFYRQTEQ